MADSRAERGDEDEDAHSLLYSDLNETSAFQLDFKRDHCDLLLDAMDAQLDQLQVQPTKYEATSRELHFNDAAPQKRSPSLSKDTGFGGSTQTNDTPMSCLELMHTPTTEQISENSSDCWERPVMHKEAKEERDREDAESWREQVIWRLERLLGDTWKGGGVVGEAQAPSDSIRTEDFVRRFREEMVEAAVPDGRGQRRDGEEEDAAEGTDVSDRHTCQREERHHSIAGVERREIETHTSLRAAVLTNHENVQHNNSCSPKARCLAGVPVLSFDAVSIDSDLDTVRTEEVRQHIHERTGWKSLIQCVTDMNDAQSDCDTVTQEDSEPPAVPGQRSSSKENRSISVNKAAQHSQRETSRLVCSLSDQDTDEEKNPWSGKSGTSQSDGTTMKARPSNLRQKYTKEEAALRLKRIQLRDADLCLSELQWKKKHALQDLERLTTEVAQMEEEKKTLESVVRDSRLEKDSVCCELQKWQRQKESILLQVRNTEADLAALSQRKQALGDELDMNTNRVLVSVLEREEMERQLDGAKKQLFTEQRRAREELESTQEKLEETCEELQRATEAEKSLKIRCNLLEEEQKQRKQQMKALKVQVRKLTDELRVNMTRVETLEQSVAHKELQLLESKEQCGALRSDRDGQKGALQRLETQHHKALKEAQEQAQEMKLKEEEINLLRKSLQQQKEEAKKREDQLNVEALQKFRRALEEERTKWHAENVESVQLRCAMLEEQNRKSLESLRGESQRERTRAQALQREAVELEKKVQELETESCAQQREHESLLAVVCKSLKEEHQAELQRLHMNTVQSHMTALQDVRLAAKERDGLRAALEAKERSQEQTRAEEEQRLGGWAQQLAAECQQLQRLVQQTGAKPSAASLPPSPTVAEALDNLRAFREHLKRVMNCLHEELESQKRTNEQLRKDKERELSIQRQQLTAERDQALNSMKERLIQEHIEELSSLKWAGTSGGAADGSGAATSLRRQLRAKDVELRQVQRSMARWKEQTAARLACKFEEELTAELGRCTAKLLRKRNSPQTPEGSQRTSECPGGETAGTKQEAPDPLGAPSRHAVDSAASCGSSDVASFKLLRYLQGRVKQLRVENQSFPWRPAASETASSAPI